MRRALLVTVAVTTFAAGVSASAGAPRIDYAAVALNVLPPGQSGAITLNGHSTDQVAMYDALTPRFEGVRQGDLASSFKSARFGTAGAGPTRTERTPRTGLRIVRDRYDVPHVTGRTREDVLYGVGWVSAEDRGLLMNALRLPGRAAAVDVPGLNVVQLATSGRALVPSQQTEAYMREIAGRAAPRVTRDIDAYLAGVNAYFRQARLGGEPWTRSDLVALDAVLAAIFGAGGGDEVRRAEFLDALERQLGPTLGRSVWEDLREHDDPEATVTADRAFSYDSGAASGAGNAVVDDGSFVPWSRSFAYEPARPASMSNALLVGARRSRTGHPLFVAGPQVGYSYPEFFLEADIHGGGLDARGAVFPGLPYVVVGRGKDFAWSPTSSDSDLVDLFVEELCGDDLHYRYQGACRAMDTFDVGTLRGGGVAEQQLVLRMTVHGPVAGYATVAGRRVAISRARSTRGREPQSLSAIAALDANEVRSGRDFLRVIAGVDFAFNFVYADSRDIAYYSAGRLPLRAPGVDPGLPTLGTGEYDWRGFLASAGHPQALNPRSGFLVNWNNKPARGFAAADYKWSFGSVQRVDLLALALNRRRMQTLAGVVGAMNRAATQDLRVVRVWPTLADVLRTGPAPSERAQRAFDAIEAWRERGGSRLDRDGDGLIDDAGAALLDAFWPRAARAVVAPVLGSLSPRLEQLQPLDEPPNTQGSAYQEGWFGYVDKDLRSLLGRPVQGAFRNHYCGAGQLAACRTSLWDALDGAAAAAPAFAPAERITFGSLLPGRSMRWTNRPTFQQVLTFDTHRSR